MTVRKQARSEVFPSTVSSVKSKLRQRHHTAPAGVEHSLPRNLSHVEMQVPLLLQRLMSHTGGAAHDLPVSGPLCKEQSSISPMTFVS